MSKRAQPKSHSMSSLDKEEEDILDSFERDEWESVDNIKKEKVVANQAAENYLRKDARINIRLSGNDLAKIKQRAAYEGIPYQTLIASVLHKYAAGHLLPER